MDLGHELDRGCPGAEHGDPFAGEIVVVVPVQRVEARTGESLHTGDIGELGSAVDPGRRDQDPGGEVAAVGVYSPAARHLIPCGLENFGIEPDMPDDIVVLCDRVQVGQNFRLLTVGA